MRRLCEKAGLPEPLFEEYQRGFQVTFRKDVYTEEYLCGLGLNDRQIKAVKYVKEKGKITNKEYQEINRVSRQTSSRELTALTIMHILNRIGKTGQTTYYELAPHENERPMNASQMTQTPHERLPNAPKTLSKWDGESHRFGKMSLYSMGCKKIPLQNKWF